MRLYEGVYKGYIYRLLGLGVPSRGPSFKSPNSKPGRGAPEPGKRVSAASSRPRAGRS